MNKLLMINALAVMVALSVDHWLGEPAHRWHPVVWMGHYLSWAGRWVTPPSAALQGDTSETPADWRRFFLGALAWCAGALVVSAVAELAQHCTLALGRLTLYEWHWPALVSASLGSLLLGIALKPLLAWAMLKSEVQAVETALNESLQAGRERLSWLVSRDVAALTEAQVRESAIESLAENLNDSLVAPIFWFVLLGLPGAALYRFANTADAMWGYRGVRNGRVWEWGGKWAAWADDCLSWLPARVTAGLLVLASGGLSVRHLSQQASLTPSPNSGWPMAAMALGLGVRLQKTGVYSLNSAGRSPLATDTRQAINLASKAVHILVFLLMTTASLIAFGVLF